MKTQQQKIQDARDGIKTSWIRGIFVGVLLFVYNYIVQIILINEKSFVWSSALSSFAFALLGGLLLGAIMKWFFTRRLHKLLKEP